MGIFLGTELTSLALSLTEVASTCHEMKTHESAEVPKTDALLPKSRVTRRLHRRPQFLYSSYCPQNGELRWRVRRKCEKPMVREETLFLV